MICFYRWDTKDKIWKLTRSINLCKDLWQNLLGQNKSRIQAFCDLFDVLCDEKLQLKSDTKHHWSQLEFSFIFYISNTKYLCLLLFLYFIVNMYVILENRNINSIV